MNSAAKLTIFQANTPQQVEQARTLFLEYAASLGFSLCFQNFDKELSGLPGSYAPPRGRLLLAAAGGRLSGCVGLHELEPAGVCEMKRLYVRPEFRGQGVGLALAKQVIEAAREIGYRSMRLDTVPASMAAAVRMYRLLGFQEIPPYTQNPVPGAIFMELLL